MGEGVERDSNNSPASLATHIWLQNASIETNHEKNLGSIAAKLPFFPVMVQSFGKRALPGRVYHVIKHIRSHGAKLLRQPELLNLSLIGQSLHNYVNPQVASRSKPAKASSIRAFARTSIQAPMMP